MKKNWEEKEDQILRENYPSGGYVKCMEVLQNRSKSSIQCRAWFLKIGLDILNPQKLLDRFLKTLKEKNGTPLFDSKDWKRCDTRYLVKCDVCGNEWGCLPSTLWSRGDWCKTCAGYQKKTPEEYHDMAAKYGGFWIAKTIPKNNKTDTQWRCVNGHEFDNDFNNIQQYNCFCRDCKNPYVGQAVTKMYIEALTGLIFQTCRPAFLKQLSGSNLELDGFNKEMKVAFEYNGLEHYVRSSRQSQEDFENLQKRDQWKYKTCKENNIKLLIIKEIDGKFDEEHIKKSVIYFLEEEGIRMVTDPNTVTVDLTKLYVDYDLERIKNACEKLNLTLLSDIYIGSTVNVMVKCNECQKERPASPGNLAHMVIKGKTSYCRCATKKGRKEKYNAKIIQYGFEIISDNYENCDTILDIRYPDGSFRKHSWMQFYWDHLPRYLRNLNKK